MAPRPLNTTCGFEFVEVATFRRLTYTITENIVDIISIHEWYITISGLQKQTSAILELYFRFRSRPLRRNRHVILHQAAELRPNRRTRCENMTSYPFLKMAAATDKYYFRFRICWCIAFRRLKSISKPNFVDFIWIHGWDITTFVFWKTNVRHIGILLPVSISTTSP